MAALRQSWKASKLLRNTLIQKRCLSSSRILSAEWNHFWTPGPPPLTEEEKAEAAKRYGMHPEDYKPMPLDEHPAGDYPDLPPVGEEQKDPRYPWDDPAYMRNFNEPIHYYHDVLVADRADLMRDNMPKAWVQFLITFGIIFTTVCAWIYFQQWSLPYPYMDKSYPYTDFQKKKIKMFDYDEPVRRVRHYTFEPAE